MSSTLRIGWAQVDLTPTEPVLLRGQFHARVSEGVADPITATAMAFESTRSGTTGAGAARGVLVSCDLASIPRSLLQAVRAQVGQAVPELDPALVVLNATHTHTAPEVFAPEDNALDAVLGMVLSDVGMDLPAMDPRVYARQVADRLVAAVAEAWQKREPAQLGFGLGQATVGYNRRTSYHDGRTRMYGNPNDPQFSHFESGADTSIHVVGTWDPQQRLTGVIVNVACPSQVGEGNWQVSADYWHEARQELRHRLGEGLFVLPQCSAAGDLVPAKAKTMIGWEAQQRMWRLTGVDQRQDIARRIADAVTTVLSPAEAELEADPPLTHRVQTLELPRRLIAEQDVREADEQAEMFRQKYETLRQEIEDEPARRQEPRWYQHVTRVYRRMCWNQMVAQRRAHQQQHPMLASEVHALRLGELAMVTLPFEVYLDYGHQIRARSAATQTMVVQLAGPGAYLPTQRAVTGKSYGAIPASTPVGPEAGRDLVEWSTQAIDELWRDALAMAPSPAE